MGLLLVTHDVGVAAESVDEILVMRHGRTVEHGPVATVLGAPRQTYTQELLGSVPRVDARRESGGGVSEGGVSEGGVSDEAVLEAVDLRREVGHGNRQFAAVDDVTLAIHRGETLGIVGESGSGKTTLGRMLVGLLEPTAGAVRYEGRAQSGVSPSVQMVFQDPISSLNPRRTVGESIADPLRARGERDEGRIRRRVRELLERVGLEAAHYDRYPHEFSGGQRQRVGIARALAAEPARHRVRRAGLRARRHHSGPSGSPARRVAAGAGVRAGVRGARPRGRTPGQPPGGGDAARVNRRVRARRRGVRIPAGPLHQAAAGRRTGSRPGGRGTAPHSPKGADRGVSHPHGVSGADGVSGSAGL